MGEVVKLPKPEDRQARLFEAYKIAAARAQGTLRLEDAMEAGRAWARLMRTFEGKK